ncbi:MAG TPA: PDDEXK nuclease domain-containing protein [bacterium]|nr:PDDEXK nuclease domain-containing protein [bacterium]
MSENSYPGFLNEVKIRIRAAQNKAAFSINSEMIMMYYDLGKMIDIKQKQEGWGASVIPRLSKDIQNELPEIKGFSERNIGYMIRFAREYGDSEILQLPVAKLENKSAQIRKLIVSLTWSHNIILIEKVKDLKIRSWYMEKTIMNGWSKETLALMIKSKLYERDGKSVNNFDESLPIEHSESLKNILKDPYVFDFMTLSGTYKERELETGLIRHLEKFLIELGQGFAFVGRQFHFEVDEKDFYIDLLFYHLKLRSFIVIELKKGEFKPEYAGKINFYCNIVDDKLKQETDNPTIGLILCQNKNKIMAEYSVRGINNPIGVSEYELMQALPADLKSSLPTIEEIEKELQKEIPDQKR